MASFGAVIRNLLGITSAGQKDKAGSLPVVLPSDQTVEVSSTQLPVTIGQNTSANSLPVTLPTDQIVEIEDESSILLRRLIKIMESNATVDSANRQRVTIDAMQSAMTLATVTTVTTVTTVSNMSALAGYDQRQFIDIARNTYANGIRKNLEWT